MKTFFAIIVSFAFAFIEPVKAQITLEVGDMPPFGFLSIYARDTAVGGADLGVASPSAQEWSFLALSPDERFSIETVPVEEAPAADLFPEASFVFEGNNGQYTYLRAQPGALYSMGREYSPVYEPFLVALDTEQQLLSFPATYGTSFEQAYGTVVMLTNVIGPFQDSIRVTEASLVRAEVDAYGEIELPAGTFEALRYRKEDIRELKIEGRAPFSPPGSDFIVLDILRDTVFAYEWWSKDGLGRVLEVETDRDGNALSATFLTAFNEAPTAEVGLAFLNDRQVQFTDLSTNQPSSWEWTFGDGKSSTVQNPLNTYEASGTYEACLRASNSIGSSDTACVTLTVAFVPPPAADFAAERLEGRQVQFSDLSINDPNAWEWDFGDGNNSTEQNPLHAYEEESVYQVCLTVSNLSGSDEYCEIVEAVVVKAEESAKMGEVLAVYPSPARERLNLLLPRSWSGRPVSLRCFDAQGKAVSAQRLDSAPSPFHLEVAGWPAGLYHIVVEDGRGKRLSSSFAVH